jgi:hypothetical protein
MPITATPTGGSGMGGVAVSDGVLNAAVTIVAVVV